MADLVGLTEECRSFLREQMVDATMEHATNQYVCSRLTEYAVFCTSIERPRYNRHCNKTAEEPGRLFAHPSNGIA